MGPLDPSRLGAFLMRQIPPSDGEVVERGNVLPLGTYRTPDGRETTTLAFPQPMREGLDALAYALGYRQDPNAPAGYVTHDALNKGGQGLAESAMVGSLGASRPANALGMFAGRRAKTADHAALAKAEALDAQGAPRETIWSETGWFKDPQDNQWKFEIDDSQARVLQAARLRNSADSLATEDGFVTAMRGLAPVGKPTNNDWMLHDALRAAYDDPAPKVFYQKMPDEKLAYYGEGPTEDRYIGLNALFREKVPNIRRTEKSERSTGLHELQHWVQEKEGFGRGATGGDFKYKDFASKYFKDIEDDIAIRRQEIENIQSKMSPELKKIADADAAIETDLVKKWGPDWIAKADGADLDAAFAKESALREGLSDADRKTLNALRARRAMLSIKQDELNKPLPGPNDRAFRQWQFEQYQNAPGEIEARAVQRRADLTPEQRRARFPLLDYKTHSGNSLAANPMAGAVPLAFPAPQEQQQGPMIGEQMGRRIPPEEEAQRQALIRYLQGVQ